MFAVRYLKTHVRLSNMFLEVGIVKLNYHKISVINMSLRNDLLSFLGGRGSGDMTYHINVGKI